MVIPNLRHFRFWCQSVIPLVYDDSLSYYEVLCKVVKYINDLIESDKAIVEDIEELRNELGIVQEWIDNYNTDYAKQLVEEYIATMIFVEINNNGYIVYYIPDTWDEITFETTGLDVFIDTMPEYGHLVLSY